MLSKRYFVQNSNLSNKTNSICVITRVHNIGGGIGGALGTLAPTKL